MKTNPNPLTKICLLIAALLLAVHSSPAQTTRLVNAFDSSTEVTANNGQPWINWFGTAFYQVLWDPSDASNNVNSGSIRIETFYPDSGIGGCCGPQFLAMNGYDGINPPVAGNGNSTLNIPLATNLQFDVRFDPISAYSTNTGNWPTLEVGTRGSTFNQYTFGTFTFAQTNTNWVHINIPIGASANWTNIPNVYFKTYSTTLGGAMNFYLDNIKFDMADIPYIPPVMGIQKATPALRVFARTGGQYDRAQLVAVDTNQSWVGGTFPVSYSYTISEYSINPTLNQVHLFLIPLNSAQGGVINQFTDYSTASNNLWLQIVGGVTNVTANIAWKTNLINSNPDHVALNITNATAVGTWTLTFNSDTSGTLTAPGAAPAAFSIPADAAATFANPLALFFGVQPNNPAAIGQHVDYTRFQTLGIAAPGVPINSVFTNSVNLDTNIWSTAASTSPLSMIVVNTNQAWWVYWNYPDFGDVLATKSDLSTNGTWKTPQYYTGATTNLLPYDATMGARVWKLLPTNAVPTVSGLSNGIPSSDAFFRLQKPAPAE
jgi:hypothetical protein